MPLNCINPNQETDLGCEEAVYEAPNSVRPRFIRLAMGENVSKRDIYFMVSLGRFNFSLFSVPHSLNLSA